MTATSLSEDVRRVCDLIGDRGADPGRVIIGIAGPPASGKSTLAESVVHALNADRSAKVPQAALLPMDGYHLDNRILEARGLLARKGAPETFDALGFCEAVHRLKTVDHETFYPSFNRQLDLAVANSIVIHPETRVIVVEGNYLLLASDPWASLIKTFTSTVFLKLDIETLKDRLLQRWLGHGLSPQLAESKTEANDLPNAKLVLTSSRPADLTLDHAFASGDLRSVV